MIFVQGIVVKKCGRIAIVGDEHVGVAVIVEVGEGDATSGARRDSGQAAGYGRVGEFAVGVVVEQRVVLLVERVGGDLFDLGIDVAVADEDVEPAIVVVVQKAATEAENVFCG